MSESKTAAKMTTVCGVNNLELLLRSGILSGEKETGFSRVKNEVCGENKLLVIKAKTKKRIYLNTSINLEVNRKPIQVCKE